jgi:ADP-ribose pyrophosphatase
MEFKEKTLNKNYVYRGKILNLRKDDIILPDGNTSVREIVEHGGGSTVYCEVDGKVLFVKQFRYAYGKELLELPAGKRDGDEPFEKTAIRELEEEGGVKAESVQKICEIYPSPGYTNEIIGVYKAHGVKKTAMKLDSDEFLTGVWIEKEKVLKMIENGEIKDAKTLIALLYVLR